MAVAGQVAFNMASYAAILIMLSVGLQIVAGLLGIINIANSGPQVIAPALAAPLVSQLGGYSTLWLSVAAITIAGSAFVWKIRSVP